MRAQALTVSRASVTPPGPDDWPHKHTEKRPSIVTTFRELGVLPEICDALERGGITTPFAIQEMTLSVALLGTDLIGQARTGHRQDPRLRHPGAAAQRRPDDPAYDELPHRASRRR